MAFAHWDPFRDLLALQERLDALTGDRAAGWAPPVDLFETADHYQIIAEVPGLTRDQIRVQVQNGILTIEGERSASCLPSCEQHHRVERGHGRFARSFQLHELIDSDAVDADLRDGILTIKLLKRAQEARRIPVR